MITQSGKSATEVAENYLKAIYGLSIDGGGAATQHRIAAQLGTSVSAVSKMLRSLEKAQLVEYSPYHPVKLTSAGEKIALEIIRHHRLLELYLVRTLGFGWEDVHHEADRLEHYISEQMEDRIETLLGFPSFDPHGDPIPSRDGIMPRFSVVSLASQAVGACVAVERVADEDQELLRYLAARGITPGALLRIEEREPYGGSLVVDVAGHGTQRVSPQAAASVFVETEGQTQCP